MRILCISDTTRSLAFSSNVSGIYQGTDFVISCGDIDVNNYDYLSTMLRRDVYYVFGNHNLGTFSQTMDKDPMKFTRPENEYSKKFYGFLIDGKCVRDKRTGLLIAGLGGSMNYNGGDSQYTEAQMRWRIRRLALSLMYNKRKYGRYLDILVTHAPPLGIGDGPDLCHRGFKCFLDFMDKYQPKYLLHGHVHLDDRNANRIMQHGSTTIINVYGSYMLDTEKSGEK